jgi:hypothetical protein
MKIVCLYVQYLGCNGISTFGGFLHFVGVYRRSTCLRLLSIARFLRKGVKTNFDYDVVYGADQMHCRLVTKVHAGLVRGKSWIVRE